LQAPHAHIVEHVWTPYVLQDCLAVGMQTPWFWHVPAIHIPAESHVSVSVPQLPQGTLRVCPCAQTPVHTPPMHVWFMHATALPHSPFALQVCTPSPEHCTLPGTQLPPQAPLTHTYGHGWGLPHWPFGPQVSCPLFEHWVEFGGHEPVHMPVVQTLGHCWPLFCQWPDGSHFCGCCPVHCVAPGVQLPVHAPATHA
jgi:hypothetical protein